MVESNYDILKIQSGASKNDIRKAYRSLVLKLHSDRGGDDEQFKRIQRAYEDLRIGKKYPDSIVEKKEKANCIQVIQVLTSGGKIFYCLKIFLVK